MSAYTDAAAAICAFVERCGNKPAARSAAIRSVAAHRRLDARRPAILVNFCEMQKLVHKPLDRVNIMDYNIPIIT